MKDHQTHSDECDLLAHYLVGEPATPQLKNSYYTALQKIPVKFSDDENKLWKSCLRKHWLLPYVDAYLALRKPQHPIRQKIFIMLTQLETQAGYSKFFLPEKSTKWKVVPIGIKLFHGLIKASAGRILVWIN